MFVTNSFTQSRQELIVGFRIILFFGIAYRKNKNLVTLSVGLGIGLSDLVRVLVTSCWWRCWKLLLLLVLVVLASSRSSRGGVNLVLVAPRLWLYSSFSLS